MMATTARPLSPTSPFHSPPHEQGIRHDAHAPATPTPSLSPAQIRQYLDHIELPAHYRAMTPCIELLTALHVHVISTFPYENLSLHYDPAHWVNLDVQFLFHKMVTAKKGRGGYCLEGAILYNHVLRGLGFLAYTAGTRTRWRKDHVPFGDYPGWVHIVNIIYLPDGTKYHSDVAFGGDGPTAPLPLLEDAPPHLNLGTQHVRLIRDWIPQQVLRTPESRQWIYQYRNHPSHAWNSYYAFGEHEFIHDDWNRVNSWLCTSPECNQLTNVLVIKFLRRRKEGGEQYEYELYGKRMMFNDEAKEFTGGHTRLIERFDSERKRTDGIQEIFGITLSGEQKDAIRGRPLCLDK